MMQQLLTPESSSVLSLAIMLVYVALANAAMIPFYRKRLRGEGSFNKAFLVWLSFTVTLTIVRLMEYFAVMNAGTTEGSFGIGERLTTWYLLPMLSIIAQLQFVLYILRAYKFYSVPPVLLFFLALGLYQYNDMTAYNIVMIPLAYVVSILFLWKGARNKDGLTFAIGVFSLFDYGIPYFIHSPMRFMAGMEGIILYLPLLGGALFAIAYLNLGTWGWLDRHVFYDKERERKIKNAWVSRLIELERTKAPAQRTGDKTIVIECPICHVQGKQDIPREILLERARNEKGIVKMLLNQDGEMCEHQFIAYVDRAFSIRGYEPIDLMA